MRLHVYLNHFGKRQLVGLLEEKDRIYFEYSPDFLRSGIELSPFKLPLKSGVNFDSKYTFEGLFGLFNDSLPDGWGCLLIDRMLRRRGLSYDAISPLMRLSMIGCNPMGALEYEPADAESDAAISVELDSLAGEIKAVVCGSDSKFLEELHRMNGSSGGARPKVVVKVSKDFKTIIHGESGVRNDFSDWMIKFCQQNDPQDLGKTEYLYSLMAKKAGIDMPDTYLFPSKTGDGYFGVKRFDRTECGKVHVHTASGLLHASHRYASLDYENLLKLTLVLTQDQKEVEQMVRRMIFNVVCGNRDDHSKNFSFMLDAHCKWHLAPAYDLTPSYGINGEHTAMVNGKGKDITKGDFIKAGESVGISASTTAEIYDEVRVATESLL